MPLFIRFGYFLLVGWWLTWIWVQLAWLANLIGLPAGIHMLNHVPEILILGASRLPRQGERNEIIVLNASGVSQLAWPWRLIYFLLVGWWASLIWLNVAWMLCITLLGLPLGILLFSYLPTVTTLRRLE